MVWYKNVWKWLIGALSVLGAILLYVFLTKNDAQQKVDKLETEIDDIEKDIKVKEKERKKLLEDADDHAEAGAEIDKQIEVAKKKQRNLDDKRKKMKSIFDKYGDK